jgi:hypothetical protein
MTSTVFDVRLLENILKNRFNPDSNSTALPNIYALFPQMLFEKKNRDMEREEFLPIFVA